MRTADPQLDDARVQLPPDWFVAEMPHGYQTRLAEIRRLSSELEAMDRSGRLLWEIGRGLSEVVAEAFVAMKLEVRLITTDDPPPIVVELDRKRRLLVSASVTEGVIERRSSELARVFSILHEQADDDDRVVLVVNGNRTVRPSERGASVSDEALNFLERLGVNVLTGPTMFALWAQSVQEPDRARKIVDKLHVQDGGEFKLPTY